MLITSFKKFLKKYYISNPLKMSFISNPIKQ
jgi:hypothetical protein